jgi:anthranilate phosphoribosyltransferase
LKRSSLEALRGGGAAENAQALRALLKGEKSAYRDIVVLNAAAALMVAGRVNDILAGAALAQQLLDSGAARDKLEQLVKVSNSP